MSKNYKEMLNNFAQDGEFDRDVNAHNYDNMWQVDSSYQYIPSSFFHIAYKCIIKGIIKILGPLVLKVGYNFKVIGKQNLKNVDSGITISNHVLVLDSLMNMEIMKKKKFFIIGSNYNFKHDFTGRTLRAGGYLPLSDSFVGMKNLSQTVSKVTKSQGFVHVYPEQALWPRYERSRPLKTGAFHFATINNVPVIPIIILFRQPNFLEKLLLVDKPVTAQICKPIYPNNALTIKERAIDLQTRVQQVYDKSICDFYGYNYQTYCYNKEPERISYYPQFFNEFKKENVYEENAELKHC